MKITLSFIHHANDLKHFIDIGVSINLSGIVKKKKTIERSPTLKFLGPSGNFSIENGDFIFLYLLMV
jgi:hypothetical protein